MKKLFLLFMMLCTSIVSVWADVELWNKTNMILKDKYFDGNTNTDLRWESSTSNNVVVDVKRPNATNWNEWDGWVKIHHNFTFVDGKTYKFKCKIRSTKDVNFMAIKIDDDEEMYWQNIYTVNNTNQNVEFQFTGRSTKDKSNDIILPMGQVPDGAVVTLSDISLVEVGTFGPSTAPNAPTTSAGDVNSIYSNTYGNATNFSTQEWSGCRVITPSVNGNDYVDFLDHSWSGLTFQQMNVSGRNFLHIDIYPQTTGKILIVPQYDGQTGEEADKNAYGVTVDVTANQWNYINIPLSSFNNGAGQYNFGNISQLKFTSNSSDSNVDNFAVDNIYFFSGFQPTTAAPTPIHEQAKVSSFYCGKFESNGYVSSTNADWGNGVTCVEGSVNGDYYLNYSNWSSEKKYIGWQLTRDDLSFTAWNTVHLDIYPDKDGSIKFVPIHTAGGTADDPYSYTINLTGNQWNSIDIPYSAFNVPNISEYFSSIKQFKFHDMSGITEFALDNVYFYNDVNDFAPTSAASNPMPLSVDVRSIYSERNGYGNASGFTHGQWNSTSDISEGVINDNHYRLFKNHTWSGFTFQQMDVTDMNYIHLDVFPQTSGDIKITPQYNGEDNAIKDNYSQTFSVTAGQWNQINIPLSAFKNGDDVFPFEKVAQLKIATDITNGVSNFAIDNIFFSKVIYARPLVSAAEPTRDAAAVQSIYSDKYTTRTLNTNYRADWSKSIIYAPNAKIGQDEYLYYSFPTNERWMGMSFNGFDATGMTHLHFDVYPQTKDRIRVQIKKDGAADRFAYIEAEDLTPGQWNQVDLKINMPAEELAAINQVTINTEGDGLQEFAIDNIYLYKSSELTNAANDPRQNSNDVISIYSEKSGYGSKITGDGNATEKNDNGKKYLYYTNKNSVEWNFGDASIDQAYNNFHIDFFPEAEEDGVITIYGKDVAVKAGQWNYIDIPRSQLALGGGVNSSPFRLTVKSGNINNFAIDNVFFYKSQLAISEITISDVSNTSGWAHVVASGKGELTLTAEFDKVIYSDDVPFPGTERGTYKIDKEEPIKIYFELPGTWGTSNIAVHAWGNNQAPAVYGDDFKDSGCFYNGENDPHAIQDVTFLRSQNGRNLFVWEYKGNKPYLPTRFLVRKFNDNGSKAMDTQDMDCYNYGYYTVGETTDDKGNYDIWGNHSVMLEIPKNWNDPRVFGWYNGISGNIYNADYPGVKVSEHSDFNLEGELINGNKLYSWQIKENANVPYKFLLIDADRDGKGIENTKTPDLTYADYSYYNGYADNRIEYDIPLRYLVPNKANQVVNIRLKDNYGNEIVATANYSTLTHQTKADEPAEPRGELVRKYPSPMINYNPIGRDYLAAEYYYDNVQDKENWKDENEKNPNVFSYYLPLRPGGEGSWGNGQWNAQFRKILAFNNASNEIGGETGTSMVSLYDKFNYNIHVEFEVEGPTQDNIPIDVKIENTTFGNQGWDGKNCIQEKKLDALSKGADGKYNYVWDIKNIKLPEDLRDQNGMVTGAILVIDLGQIESHDTRVTIKNLSVFEVDANNYPLYDDGIYYIYNAKQLDAFADIVNGRTDGASDYIAYLMDDIDMNDMKKENPNYQFPGIGTEEYPFNGTFISIKEKSDLTSKTEHTVNLGNSTTGLFNIVEGTPGRNQYGKTATGMSNIIEGVNIEGNITKTTNNVGGVANYIKSNTDIFNCDNAANITSVYDPATKDAKTTGSNTGGIIGAVQGPSATTFLTVVVADCVNRGNIVSEDIKAGGIIGRSGNTNLILLNLLNEGNVEVKAQGLNSRPSESTAYNNDGPDVGGIVGAHYNSGTYAEYINCGNAGNVTSTGANAGAYCGWMEAKNVNITNGYNSGEVNHIQAYAAGAQTEHGFTQENLYRANGAGDQRFVLNNVYDARYIDNGDKKYQYAFATPHTLQQINAEKGDDDVINGDLLAELTTVGSAKEASETAYNNMKSNRSDDLNGRLNSYVLRPWRQTIDPLKVYDQGDMHPVFDPTALLSGDVIDSQSSTAEIKYSGLDGVDVENIKYTFHITDGKGYDRTYNVEKPNNGATNLTYQFTGLTPNTKYTVTITAVDVANSEHQVGQPVLLAFTTVFYENTVDGTATNVLFAGSSERHNVGYIYKYRISVDAEHHLVLNGILTPADGSIENVADAVGLVMPEVNIVRETSATEKQEVTNNDPTTGRPSEFTYTSTANDYVDNSVFTLNLKYMFNGGQFITAVQRFRIIDGQVYVSFDERAVNLAVSNAATHHGSKQYTGTAVRILMHRPITNPGNWNSICFPFSMDANQVASKLGSNTEIRTISQAVNRKDGMFNLGFAKVNDIEVGKAYIVRNGDVISDNFTMTAQDNYGDAVAINTFTPGTTTATASKDGVENAKFGFWGNFEKTKVNNCYVFSANKLYTVTKETDMKGFRAAIGYSDLTQNGAHQLTALSFVLDEDLIDEEEDNIVTGIDGIADEVEDVPVYTINGINRGTVKTANLPKGLYIVNGKKVVIK